MEYKHADGCPIPPEHNWRDKPARLKGQNTGIRTGTSQSWAPAQQNAEGSRLHDVQYAEVDGLYASMDDSAPSHTNFAPIGVDELLQAEIHDHFFHRNPPQV